MRIYETPKLISELRYDAMRDTTSGHSIFTRLTTKKEESSFLVTNVNDSDYVIASLARTILAIPSVNVSYSDVEMKINIALKGLAEYDWNTPIYYGLDEYPGVTSFEGAVGYFNEFQLVAADRIGRTYYSTDDRYAFWANCIFRVRYINSKYIAIPVFCPVVRQDHFADYRLRNAFRGQINHEKVVEYWISEYFMTGDKPDKLFWKAFREWADPIFEANFRMRIVSQEQLNALGYKLPEEKLSLSEIKQKGRDLLKSTYLKVVLNEKPNIMSRMTEIERDYLELQREREQIYIDAVSQGLITQNDNDEEDSDEEVEDDEEELVEAPDEPTPQASPWFEDPVTEQDLTRIPDELRREIPVGAGILAQMENAVPQTYNELTREDMERVINELAGSSSQVDYEAQRLQQLQRDYERYIREEHSRNLQMQATEGRFSELYDEEEHLFEALLQTIENPRTSDAGELRTIYRFHHYRTTFGVSEAQFLSYIIIQRPQNVTSLHAMIDNIVQNPPRVVFGSEGRREVMYYRARNRRYGINSAHAQALRLDVDSYIAGLDPYDMSAMVGQPARVVINNRLSTEDIRLWMQAHPSNHNVIIDTATAMAHPEMIPQADAIIHSQEMTEEEAQALRARYPLTPEEAFGSTGPTIADEDAARLAEEAAQLFQTLNQNEQDGESNSNSDSNVSGGSTTDEEQETEIL